MTLTTTATVNSDTVQVAQSLVKRYATKATRKRWNVRDVKVIQKKPYTMVLVWMTRGITKGRAKDALYYTDNRNGTGFSKQRPTDTWNETIGVNVALSRAIRDALGIKEAV